MKQKTWIGLLLAMIIFSLNTLTVFAEQAYPNVDFAVPTLSGVLVTFESGVSCTVDYTGDGNGGVYYCAQEDDYGFNYVELCRGANKINQKIVAEYIQKNPDSALAKLANTKGASHVVFASSCKKIKNGKELLNAIQGTVTYKETQYQIYLVAGERFARGEMYARAALEKILTEVEETNETKHTS